jgi:hypothetical protein
VTILIKPFLYLIAFGPLAVLFASVFGLACWLLMVCVRAISLASFTWLQVSARPAGPVLFINRRTESDSQVPFPRPRTPSVPQRSDFNR